MTYRVLEDFSDKQDDRRHYKAGDTYPREGLEPSPQRIAQLSGKRPVIEPVAEKPKRKRRKE